MQPEKDTILYILTKSQEYLKNLGVPNPRLDAEILLSDLLSLERIKLYSNFDKKLSEVIKNEYRKRIKERGNFKPVAYITGKKYFYKSEFIVNQTVLIPRPETEELVEWILEKEREVKLEILDLGTGSGCIGISLKKENPNWNITLSDKSEESLNTALENSKIILGEELIHFHSDLFNSFPPEISFDIIVSNPPYIPIEEKDSLMKDVIDFEPHEALFLEDPSNFFNLFLIQAKQRLKPGGKIYLEVHSEWAKKIQEISKDLLFNSCTIKKDYSEKDRMLRIEL